jgi:hypothetical protein
MRLFLQWEQERFGDLHFLDQRENMNNGKSYEYFADLSRWYPTWDPKDRLWDYAMKADDDSLINLPLLADKLRPMTPRWDTYVVCSEIYVTNEGARDGLLAYGGWILAIVGFSAVFG